MVTPAGSSQKEDDDISFLILCLLPAGDRWSIYTVCPSIPPGSFVKLFILGSEALDLITALYFGFAPEFKKKKKTFQLIATGGIVLKRTFSMSISRYFDLGHKWNSLVRKTVQMAPSTS